MTVKTKTDVLVSGCFSRVLYAAKMWTTNGPTAGNSWH